MFKRLLTFVAIMLFKGGDIDMVTVYVTLIIHGRRDFDKIPTNLKEAVKADLEGMGLGTDGKPLLTE